MVNDRKIPEHTEALVCVECGNVTAHGIGWRGYLTADDEEPVEVVILCPECAAREFDGPYAEQA